MLTFQKADDCSAIRGKQVYKSRPSPAQCRGMAMAGAPSTDLETPCPREDKHQKDVQAFNDGVKGLHFEVPPGCARIGSRDCRSPQWRSRSCIIWCMPAIRQKICKTYGLLVCNYIGVVLG